MELIYLRWSRQARTYRTKALSVGCIHSHRTQNQLLEYYNVFCAFTASAPEHMNKNGGKCTTSNRPSEVPTANDLSQAFEHVAERMVGSLQRVLSVAESTTHPSVVHNVLNNTGLGFSFKARRVPNVASHDIFSDRDRDMMRVPS